MIELKNINFSYQKKEKIIQNFNLQIPKNSIFGFLGPNGAGKTTIIRLILNLLYPQNGEILIDNKLLKRNSINILKNIGSLIENPSLYNHLTGRENLELLCIYYKQNKTSINEILKKVNLLEAGNKKVKKYSLGMKQRLGIASSLIHNPELLILDEPMSGLDPQGIAEIRKIIIHLNQKEGKTIFYSSHLLNEIENTCTDIGIINLGKNIFSGKINELRDKISKKNTYQINCANAADASKIIENKFKINTELQEDTILLDIDKKEIISKIIVAIVEQKIQLYEIKKLENNLEKLFLQLTNSN